MLLGLDYLRERLGRRRKTFVEMQGKPSLDSDRILALLAGGNRALEAGHAELATQAADGVLELDPRNQEALLLKARAAGDMAAEIMLLRTALHPEQEHAKAA